MGRAPKAGPPTERPRAYQSAARPSYELILGRGPGRSHHGLWLWSGLRKVTKSVFVLEAALPKRLASPSHTPNHAHHHHHHPKVLDYCSRAEPRPPPDALSP